MEYKEINNEFEFEYTHHDFSDFLCLLLDGDKLKDAINDLNIGVKTKQKSLFEIYKDNEEFLMSESYEKSKRFITKIHKELINSQFYEGLRKQANVEIHGFLINRIKEEASSYYNSEKELVYLQRVFEVYKHSYLNIHSRIEFIFERHKEESLELITIANKSNNDANSNVISLFQYFSRLPNFTDTINIMLNNTKVLLSHNISSTLLETPQKIELPRNTELTSNLTNNEVFELLDLLIANKKIELKQNGKILSKNEAFTLLTDLLKVKKGSQDYSQLKQSQIRRLEKEMTVNKLYPLLFNLFENSKIAIKEQKKQ